MECDNCGSKVSLHHVNCPACGKHAGFPNVRLAERPEEVTEMAKRLADAEASAQARGFRDVLTDFGEAMLRSEAIIARPLNQIEDLVSNPLLNYTTYQYQVASQARTPESHGFDQTRNQFEAALHPNFHQEIRFANLTLDGRWLRKFGAAAMVLKENMISHRSTVFEENPSEFVKRHKLLMTDPIPPGYRATWARRPDLAKAKLYGRLDDKTTPNQYPGILLSESSDPGKSDDYIEVHIYGPFNRDAIDRIYAFSPASRDDKMSLRRISRLAADADISIEEI